MCNITKKDEINALAHRNVVEKLLKRDRQSSRLRSESSIGAENEGGTHIKLAKYREYIGALVMLLIASLVVIGLLYVANTNLKDTVLFLEQLNKVK